MIGQNAPTDPVDRFARELADMRVRIAELERVRQGTPWQTPTGVVKYGGSTANVTSTCRWRTIGHHVEAEFGWATTGAPTAGSLELVLPLAVVAITGAGNAFPVIGQASCIDQGTARYVAAGVLVDFDVSGTTGRVQNSTGGLGFWSSTSPMSWANTDFGLAVVRYRYR